MTDRHRVCTWPKALMAVGFLTFMAMTLLGCGGSGVKPAATPGVPVTVSKAVIKDMPQEISAVGSIEAVQSVTVTPQVSGKVKQIHFKEGQDIRQGDLLFTLDPETYEKELSQYQAKLNKEMAQARRDSQEAERYGKLVHQGAVSRSEHEKYATVAATQWAAVADAQAAVDKARVNLEYCYIRAPIDGRVGALQVKQGDVVTANSTKLLIVNQLQPVYAKFTLPEKYLAQIRQNQAVQPMNVTVLANGLVKGVEGKLDFINNAVDTASGTIALKAIFPNTDTALWPGQYVSVALTLSIVRNAVVVPAQALQTGQDGIYAFVVKEDQSVEARKVTTGLATARETVIIQGVSAGETVVTDGQLNLKNGVKVHIK